jgi:hypothetical protein
MMPPFSEADAQRIAIYDAALKLVHERTFAEAHRATVKAFLDDTRDEDMCVRGGMLVEGSGPYLMRSALRKAGNSTEKATEEKFPELRLALASFADAGTPFPQDLLPAARVSIMFYKGVAMQQMRTRPTVLA